MKGTFVAVVVAVEDVVGEACSVVEGDAEPVEVDVAVPDFVDVDEAVADEVGDRDADDEKNSEDLGGK